MPFVNIGDINVYYRVFAIRTGSEIDTIEQQLPTMIVLHGGFGIIDHQIELAAWKPFASEVQLIFIDQRGHGRTDDGDPVRWTMDQFADDIFNFSQVLQIKNPIVGGVSAGGYAAIAYAIRYPSHPKALVLANTEPVVSPAARVAAFTAIGERSDRYEFQAFKGMSDTEIKAFVENAANASQAYDLNPALENFADFGKYCFPIISKKPFELTTPIRTNMIMKNRLANGYKLFDYSAQMHQIKCPVLWLAGEWDPIHPATCTIEGAKQLAHVDLKILKAGDPVYQDQPEQFKELVFNFFKTIL